MVQSYEEKKRKCRERNKKKYYEDPDKYSKIMSIRWSKKEVARLKKLLNDIEDKNSAEYKKYKRCYDKNMNKLIEAGVELI